MTQQLNQVIYLSQAAIPIDARALNRIQNSSVRNNLKRRISGFLIYRSGYFLQFLEGRLDRLDPLLKVIEADERHRSFEIVHRGTTDRRIVQGWNMAVFNLEALSPYINDDTDPRLPLLDAMLSIQQLSTMGTSQLRAAIERTRRDILTAPADAQRAA